MKIVELNKIHKAPASGQMLAYARDQVIFEPYSSLDAVLSRLSGKDLLEVHLFDQSKEYRAVSSRMQAGPIEHTADFDKNVNVYQEHIHLNAEGYQNDRLLVLNQVDYDEAGMIRIVDYRMILEADHE